MIRKVKGNLLYDDAEALVNTVNTQGVMGKGIALQFKEMFPENYRLYRAACREGIVKVGQMFVFQERIDDRDRIIVNFPTKTSWRQPSRYEYIDSGLNALRSEIETRGIKSIAIPPLGTGNGGLDWNRVYDMMVETLDGIDCEIRIYEPSDVIVERLKKERVRLTPARAMLLSVMGDMVASGEFASVMAAEKIVYFLQRIGGKDLYGLDFIRAYYGPYSGGKVAHVLHYLNGSYIMGMGGMDARPLEEIWLVGDSLKDVDRFLNASGAEKYRDLTDKTKGFLEGFYSQFSLELLGTVDFILQDKAFKDWTEMNRDTLERTINEDLKKWSPRKSKLFSGTPYVGIVLDHIKTHRTLLGY